MFDEHLNFILSKPKSHTRKFYFQFTFTLSHIKSLSPLHYIQPTTYPVYNIPKTAALLPLQQHFCQKKTPYRKSETVSATITQSPSLPRAKSGTRTKSKIASRSMDARPHRAEWRREEYNKIMARRCSRLPYETRRA